MAFSGPSGLDQLLWRPEQESAWRRFYRSPVRFATGALYSFCQLQPKTGATSPQICIVCVSDTHNTQPNLPDGDVLVHTGDFTQSGSVEELQAQIEWLDEQPHRYKVVVAGNHELCLDRSKAAAQHHQAKRDTSMAQSTDEPQPAPTEWRSLIYLQHSSTTLRFGSRELRVFGSPYTPQHGNWAFQYPRNGLDRWKDDIPDETDILLTHGPPKTHLDVGRLGCLHLLRALWSMKRKPILHVFGHIHGGYGEETLWWDAFQATYELILNEDAGWMAFVRLVYYGVQRVGARLFGNDGQCTRLVNAAAIGGVRDEKRREPIVVFI